MPIGLILLAAFGLLLGLLGIWSGIDSLFFAPESDLSLKEELERMAAESPPEYRQQVRAVIDNPQMVDTIDSLLKGARKIVPNPVLYEVSSFLLSALALAAGIAVFARKEWGRVLEIWFIVLATLSAVYFGFDMIPGAVGFLELTYRQFGIGKPPEYLENNIYLIWTVICIVLFALHGGIVYYLTRPGIKAVFESE